MTFNRETRRAIEKTKNSHASSNLEKKRIERNVEHYFNVYMDELRDAKTEEEKEVIRKRIINRAVAL